MASWLEQIDPGGHRRIKGLRLVVAYGLAAALGITLHRSYDISGSQSLSFLAAGFALLGERFRKPDDSLVVGARPCNSEWRRGRGRTDVRWVVFASNPAWSSRSRMDSDHRRVSRWISQTIWNPRRGRGLPNLYRPTPCVRCQHHAAGCAYGVACWTNSSG